jgi:hypothetical protein
VRKLTLILAVLLVTSLVAHAQEVPTQEQKEDQVKEWVKLAKKWRHWAENWFNKATPPYFGRVRKRPIEPQPPLWLPFYCSATTLRADEKQIFNQACQLLTEIELLANGSPLNQQTIIQQRKDERRHTKFFERIIFDGAHMVSSKNSHKQPIGYVGMHVSLFHIGRVHLFGPPGVLVLKNPNGQIKYAFSYGASIALKHFPFSQTKTAVIYANLMKVWLHNPESTEAMRSGLDMVGISISFKNLNPPSLKSKP